MKESLYRTTHPLNLSNILGILDGVAILPFLISHVGRIACPTTASNHSTKRVIF